MPLIRVRHPAGTWRIEVTPDETLVGLSEKLSTAHLDGASAASVASRLSRDPGGREPLIGGHKLKTALTTLGLDHGAMVHLQPKPEPPEAPAVKETPKETPKEPKAPKAPKAPEPEDEMDPAMAEAIAIARAADAAEDEPRAADATVREALIGPPVTDDLTLARLMAAREIEATRASRAARSLLADARHGNRRLRRRQRELDDFPSIDSDDASRIPMPPASPPPFEPPPFDDDAALQAALLASTQGQEPQGDDDLARALAMSMEQPAAESDDVSALDQPTATAFAGLGGDDDEMDEALQSALLRSSEVDRPAPVTTGGDEEMAAALLAAGLRSG